MPSDERVCVCGHPMSEHALLDHDGRTGDGGRARRELRLARWHWICQADVHPNGEAESPWDHVCGCIVNIWEQAPGKPTVDSDTPTEVLFELKRLLREAVH